MSRVRPIAPSTNPFRAIAAEPLEGRRLLAATAMRPQAEYFQHAWAGNASETTVSFNNSYNESYTNGYGQGYGQPHIFSPFAVAMMIARAEMRQAADIAAANSGAADASASLTQTSTPSATPSFSNGSGAATLSIPVTSLTISQNNAAANNVPVTHVPAPQQTSTATAAQPVTGSDSQFMAADGSADIAIAPVAAATQDNADADAGHVFGPFNIQITTAEAAPAQATDSGLANLLNGDADTVDAALRWQAQDATYRPRRSNEPTSAADAEGTLPTVVKEQAMEQASMLPIAEPLAAKPVWQRLALMTAGATFVVANWFVRRRREKLAMRAIIRR